MPEIFKTRLLRNSVFLNEDEIPGGQKPFVPQVLVLPLHTEDLLPLLSGEGLSPVEMFDEIEHLVGTESIGGDCLDGRLLYVGFPFPAGLLLRRRPLLR